MIVTHRPPSSCPVCSTGLITLRLGCPECGTELSGHFSSCRYCRLDTADLEILEVFLRGRGNVRDVQAHLEVSYPTARVRLQDVLDRLGLGEVRSGPTRELRPDVPAVTATRLGGPSASGDSPVDVASGGEGRFVAAVLAELATGRIDVSAAESLIDRLAGTGASSQP